MSGAVLEVDELRTYFGTGGAPVKAVDGVSFEVRPGEVLGLVGESGSGKTVTGFSIMRLVEPPGKVVGGRIHFLGQDILALPEHEMRSLRGRRIAMIFQDPMMTLNPVLSIGTHLTESVFAHERVSREEARRRACDVLGQVGIPSPEERLSAYPHQFSGGMRQRVAIAIALLHRPDLIIADEPTTALDVTIQSQILAAVQKLAADYRMALIWITHDLGVVAGLAQRIAVMYAGRIVECGSVDDVLDRPAHPYTVGLMNSIPASVARGAPLRPIAGMAPPAHARPVGCAFRPRCAFATAACEAEPAPVNRAGREYRCHHPRTEAPR